VNVIVDGLGTDLKRRGNLLLGTHVRLVQLCDGYPFCQTIFIGPLHIPTAFYHENLPALVVDEHNTLIGWTGEPVEIGLLHLQYPLWSTNSRMVGLKRKTGKKFLKRRGGNGFTTLYIEEN
jgi:hypothetical protein